MKNFSLIIRDNKIELAPAYVFLNTTIVARTTEEMALPLNGRKNNLKKPDFIDYFAREKLGLSKLLWMNYCKVFPKFFRFGKI